MALGTPALVSSIPCLQEVCGDAAEYFDPYNVRNIRDAIEAIARDDCKVAELRKKGLERAARFSHERSAEQLDRAYRYALDRSARR